ncbi:hypothetical protein RJ639_040926 [Escallonia herrerae]|uniref:Squalene cyclase N-terminal domain-containing protein n=1 Tax=Escallonia herrerae TaxID=1293975 RepID=A0AA88WF03_9ASTE|nr:hypothetical protein RJ639_040926 [Escallonia herrerae]
MQSLKRCARLLRTLLIWLIHHAQFAREHPDELKLPQVKVGSEVNSTAEEVETTLRRALRFYSTIQAEDGHWPGDYAGPLFLLPGLVIGLHVMGHLNTVLSDEHQKEIRRYMYNHQNVDGGWGLHIEGCSTMLCTGLSYVALRLLGEKMDSGNGAVENARKWILDHGGITYIPSWGKMWLSVLGAYEWSGNNPLPPEMWLLPYFLPLHPGRMWCHCRMVYLPMSYLYGKRFVGSISAVTLSLRKELYLQPYHKVNWDLARNQCAKGYNGSQLWDAAFAVQAILATNLTDEYGSMLKKANDFVKISQVTEDSSSNPSSWYRHISKGGWNFSTLDQGWPVTDSTAEGFKAAILLCQMPADIVGEAMAAEKLYDTVNLTLSLQVLNPAETFGDIIIDYS